MLHLCVRHKNGYEIEMFCGGLLEYGEYEYRDIETAQRMLFVLPMSAPLGLPEALGLFDTLSSKDVHPACRKEAAKEIRAFIKKELSCLTTSTIPNTTPGSKV